MNEGERQTSWNGHGQLPMRVLCALAMLSTFVLALAACDSLTGPSFPEVAGTYTGPVTLGATVVFQGVPDTITVNGSMTVVVEQDVDQVTLSGSMTILGDTDSLDTISGTINEAGVWTETGAETGAFVFDDDECGLRSERGGQVLGRLAHDRDHRNAFGTDHRLPQHRIVRGLEPGLTMPSRCSRTFSIGSRPVHVPPKPERRLIPPVPPAPLSVDTGIRSAAGWITLTTRVSSGVSPRLVVLPITLR